MLLPQQVHLPVMHHLMLEILSLNQFMNIIWNTELIMNLHTMQMATKLVVFTHSTISPSQQISLPEAKLSKLLIIIDHNKPHMTNTLSGNHCQWYFLCIFSYFSGRSFRCFSDSSYFFSSFRRLLTLRIQNNNIEDCHQTDSHITKVPHKSISCKAADEQHHTVPVLCMQSVIAQLSPKRYATLLLA